MRGVKELDFVGGGRVFGYVIANQQDLSEPEKQQYKAFYCGLCHALAHRYGLPGRLTLNYDMAFLSMLLSSVYGLQDAPGRETCLLHPFKKHTFFAGRFSAYAADMNIALSYYKFRDDWQDDRSLFALWLTKLFGKRFRRAAARYPRQCRAIEDCLSALSAAERRGELNPDIPARLFGALMAEVFVPEEDQHAEKLRAFGSALGKLIYIMDACVDFRRDLKKAKYNPLVATPSAVFDDMLADLAADCGARFEQLGLTADKSIMENILYSGVWTRLNYVRWKEGRLRGE